MIDYYNLIYSYFHELYLERPYELRKSKGNEVLWNKLIKYCDDNNQDVTFILYKCFSYHLYKVRKLKDKKTLNLSLALSYLPHIKTKFIDSSFVLTPFLRGIESLKYYIPNNNELSLLLKRECLKFKNTPLPPSKERLRKQAVNTFYSNYNYFTLFKNMLLINGIDHYNIFLSLQPVIINWLDNLEKNDYNKVKIIFTGYDEKIELKYCKKLSNLIEKGNMK